MLHLLLLLLSLLKGLPENSEGVLGVRARLRLCLGRLRNRSLLFCLLRSCLDGLFARLLGLILCLLRCRLPCRLHSIRDGVISPIF